MGSQETSAVVEGWNKERNRGGRLVNKELFDPPRWEGEQNAGGLLQSWG